MATYAKFIHNGQMQTVALIEGLQSEELTNLLKTIFNINTDIVGIMAEKGLVIPISLVAKNPQVIPNTVCKILVKGGKIEENSSSFKDSTVTAASTKVNASTSNISDAREENVTEEESIEYVTAEIQNFIDGLQSGSFIDSTQYKLLTQLLKQNATLLFAAYSVAISANDNEYFAEICKDLGSSLMTKQGRLACEAQDEVLQVCDQLYMNENITENQLLYLRHLTLIRDEEVAKVYDDFQEHGSVQVLATDLHYLANTHPYKTREKADEESDAQQGKEESASYNAKQLLSGLSGVVALMLRARMLTNTESTVLLDMINDENEFIIAAFDLYRKDGNLEELQDTLIRCVKLEVRKRVADAQEEELNQRYEQALEDENDDDEGDDDEEDEEEDDEEDEDDQGNEEEGDADNFSLEDISLESILQSLKIDNIWDKIVPEPFIKAVFIAVIRKQLDADQARALCDLYHAKYDLVHAAWEVYMVQNDHNDFIDTLRRVVRDLDFEEIKKDTTTRQQPKAQSNLQPKVTESAQPASSKAPATASFAEQQRTDALRAVKAAKYQLLKHSLDMLVKQNLISEEKSNGLVKRYEEGDIMVDAAIETYANDRDVVEFLDTLQILANNSREDLEDLMKAAEQDEEDEKARNQPTSNNSSAQPEETEGGFSMSDMAFLQIEDIVQEMLKNNMIGPNIAQAFRILMGNRDQRLVVAYETYLQNKNGADLVDTLLRIVIASVESMSSVPSNESSNGQKSPVSTPAQAQQSSPRKGGTVIPSADQRSVINILQRAKSITAEQAVALSAMVDEDDFRINRVFSYYEQHKDIYKLMEDLKNLKPPSDDGASPNASMSQANSSQATAGSLSNLDDEEDDDEYEEEEDEGPARESEDINEEIDEDDRETVEMKFIQVIQSMQLSDIETAALRLAIARDDETVRRAIDMYRITSNDTALRQALLQAARDTIRQTLDNNDEDEDDEDEDDNDDGQEEEEDDGMEETRRVYANSYRTNNAYRNYDYDQSEEAEDSEEEEGDDEDNEEGDEEGENEDEENMTSQSARDHIFPILVYELVKETIIDQKAANTILKLFSQNDSDVNSALDAYDQDSDMGSLVAHLQRIVKNKA